MACSSRKRIAIRRKLYLLRTLTNSTSVEASSIINDAFLHISALKLKLEILKRENMVMKHTNHQLIPLLEVKVEKLEDYGFRLRVMNEKRRNNLVYILQAFEEMGIVVVQASVSCNSHFAMEAIVEVNNVDNQDIDPSVLREVIMKAIEKSGRSSLLAT